MSIQRGVRSGNESEHIRNAKGLTLGLTGSTLGAQGTVIAVEYSDRRAENGKAEAAGAYRMMTNTRRLPLFPLNTVLGAEGLRVVDASIMPECVRANINVTVLMIGERIADFIKQGK